MKIRIKKKNKDGIVRVESSGNIKEVLINEDIMNPAKETVSVCFRGKSSSGIIDFSTKEIENLLKSIQGRTQLIKGIEKLDKDIL